MKHLWGPYPHALSSPLPPKPPGKTFPRVHRRDGDEQVLPPPPPFPLSSGAQFQIMIHAPPSPNHSSSSPRRPREERKRRSQTNQHFPPQTGDVGRREREAKMLIYGIKYEAISLSFPSLVGGGGRWDQRKETFCSTSLLLVAAIFSISFFLSFFAGDGDNFFLSSRLLGRYSFFSSFGTEEGP